MLTFLISTLNDGIYKILPSELGKMKKVIIVHQVNNDLQSKYKKYFDEEVSAKCINVNYVQSYEAGLSKSRNLAIEMCDTDWAYILDDDIRLFENSRDLICESIINNNDKAMLTFLHSNLDGDKFKQDRMKEFNHNIYTAARISSIDMAVNIEKIKSNKISFDVGFGLGTEHPSGEEYIFACDCLREGLAVRHIPLYTTKHDIDASGNDFFSNEKKIKAKSAMFERITGRHLSLLKVLFFLKKAPVLLRNNRLGVFFKNYFF